MTGCGVEGVVNNRVPVVSGTGRFVLGEVLKAEERFRKILRDFMQSLINLKSYAAVSHF